MATAPSPTITGVIGVSRVAGVEAEPRQPRLEVAGVVPQPLDQLRLGLQHVDRREAGRRDGRRMRTWRRGTAAPVCSSNVEQRSAAGDVAAQHADRLGERPHLDVHPAVQAEVVDRARARCAQHAGGVGVVHVDDRIALLRRSTISGSVAMSPSMLKTPSVMSRMVRSAPPGAFGTRARIVRMASMSLWAEDLRSALDSRMPSMIEAWLSSSETISAPSAARIGITPVLHVKPDWKVSVGLDLLEFGQLASSCSWRLIVPAMVRTAPEPAP